MTELKPCPFCGKPVNIYYSSATKGYYAVHLDEQHSDCIILMPISIDHNRILYSLSDAFAAWNRRANGNEEMSKVSEMEMAYGEYFND